jgi:myo-inositol 2-dehydrogenase/D-chiro-inositol 1-dehydrogenase
VTPSSQTRVGLIGCGYIGRRHLDVLSRVADARVVAVADELEGRAVAAAEEAGASAYVGYADMLGAETLDAVFVCVPPYAHGQLELDLVERGLPFFVEKPLAADAATAERVGAAVEASGLPTAVGYHWRYLDTVAHARELLAENPARLAVGRWWDTTPPPAWWGLHSQSGGQVVEQATHLLDLMRLLVGEPDGIAWAATRAPRPAYPEADIDDVTAVTLRFPTGSVASLSATCILAAPHAIGLTLLCEGMALDLSETELAVTTAAGTEVARAQVDPFLEEDAGFLRAVRGEPGGIRAPYAEALRTHRLTTAVARRG